MIETAVIMAAGLGSRLKDRTKEKPKGFLVLNDKPIIEESVIKLLNAGIKKIIIGTGYLSNVFDEFALKYPQISCVKSDKYETTSSMFTLYNLQNEVKGDFLLLESDLIYDKNGLKTLIDLDYKDVILASGKTGSGDEVYIEADKNKMLVNMSKDKTKLNDIYGELVGISKVSYKTFGKLCAYSKEAFETNPKIDYERAFTGISKENKILIHKIDGYPWCEIDDESHLKRALTEVYPKIKESENAN